MTTLTQRTTRTTSLVVALLAMTATAGIATALVTDANVTGKTLSDERFRGVSIQDAALSGSLVEKADVVNSTLRDAEIRQASVRGSHLMDVSVRETRLADSRVDDGRLRGVALHDVTLCGTDAPGVRGGEGCWLVDGGRVLAGLSQDAPALAKPGDSFDLRIRPMGAGSLTVRNDAPGTTALGFDPTAKDASVARLELVGRDGAATAFAMGEAVALPEGQEMVTVRVHVAETGIVDGSKLGLVLDLDGHGLRAAMTTLDVTATRLAFAPPEMQAFAPFLADNVARLVIMLPTDEDGNVDRDVNVSMSVHVDAVHADDVRLADDVQDHAYLHGDSELFSDDPFGYVNPTSEVAHNPSTLEFILRDLVGVPGVTYGAADFHATHLVVQSPYPANVTLTAHATNARGEHLMSMPYDLAVGPLPDEQRTVAAFGQEFTFPGAGTLRVNYLDENGDPVERQEGWELRIQETPQSHRTELRVHYPDADASDDQRLAASTQAGLPFGDFFPHEYQVCLHHDGRVDCANDGELVAIRTGEVTEVDIVVR